MQEFRAKFIEDCSDLILDLEKDLLQLENSPKDINLIQKVFRAMHSLKGVSSMFGFEKITEITHQLETIYDLLRDSKLLVNQDIISITFDAIDHIKVLLDDNLNNTDDCISAHAKLLEKINKKINNSSEQNKNTKSEPDKETVTTIENFELQLDNLTNNESPAKNKKTFYIKFIPDKDLFIRGISAIGLFEEVSELGEVYMVIHPENIPSLAELNSTSCYTFWEFILVTDSNITDIEDVFIFVEDNCNIEQIADNNILLDNEVQSILTERKNNELLNIEKIKSILKNTIKQKEKTETETELETKIVSNSNETTNLQEKNTVAKFKELQTSSIRVSAEKLDELMNLVSQLVTTNAELNLISEQHEIANLISVAEKVEKLTRQLRDNALNIRLIPLENLMFNMKRLARDLSIELKKEIDFSVEGADNELDKTIIDALSNPLMHILRNSIDHGIEDVETRKKLGKSPVGKIQFIAFHKGINVFIQIRDDGAGINLDKVKETAINKGYISSDVKISDKDILSLIFTPGFTTAKNVSEISGRGVGMDVVNRKISDIGGNIEIETETNLGTTITIKLPITLSIIDTLLVKISDIHFLIPFSVVDNCYETTQNELLNASSKRIVIEDELIPYIYLRKEFEIHGNIPKSERIVVVHHDDNKIGIIVDNVVGEHQAVLKPLGEMFKNHDIISGASILGDGSVAMILDTNKLINQLQNQNNHLFTIGKRS